MKRIFEMSPDQVQIVAKLIGPAILVLLFGLAIRSTLRLSLGEDAPFQSFGSFVRLYGPAILITYEIQAVRIIAKQWADWVLMKPHRLLGMTVTAGGAFIVLSLWATF